MRLTAYGRWAVLMALLILVAGAIIGTLIYYYGGH